MNYRPMGFMGTPPVVKNLMILNALIWLAGFLLPQVDEVLIGYGALYNVLSPNFYSWQVVTYMFLHGSFSHLFFNMFALWMFGRTLEYDLGSKRFLTYYMVCGIGAGLIQMLVCLLTGSNVPTVGASGAVFGILLSFGMLHPNNVIMLMFPPIPLKAKWFVIIYGALELMYGVCGGDSIAHFAHLGFLLLRYWKNKGKIFY